MAIIRTKVRRPATPRYDCSKCPAYCCSYDRIGVTRADIQRLAVFFGKSYLVTKLRYTKMHSGDRVLRHKKDHIYKSVCQFLDSDTRRCTVYEGRPEVCREYPEGLTCGYYEFLSWEREHQDDETFIPTI
ncbi:MAG: YkgJ family cysteine cluster protein [Acidobacteriota bacterium]